MDDVAKLLGIYFKKVEDVKLEEPNNDDMLILGDYWEFIDPKEVEAWSLKMVPHRQHALQYEV